jgi:zinc protease
MTRTRIKTVLFAAALALGCEPKKDDTNPPGGGGDTAQLAQSTDTVVLADAQDPTVSYLLWFKVGSNDDPAGKEGLAYLTAQMLAQGSTTEHSYQDIVEALFPMAARYSARVDREMTTLRGRTHKDNQAAFQKLFTDAYLKPAFGESDFERIRQDALSRVERRLRYAQDEELGKAVLYGSVFRGNGYAHPSYGTVAGLQSITIDDIKQFYASHYTQDRLVFGLAGSVDESIQASLEATREQLPATGEAPVLPPVPASFFGRHLTLVDKPGADASISFGFPIDVHRGQRDYYALWIANSWLGEHRNSSSHLYDVIRGKRGLNYGDYSYIEVFPGGGGRQMPPPNVGRHSQIFEVWIRTLPNEHAHFALRAAIRELQDLVDGGMTQEEFELTREFLTKYSLHYADTPSARLGYAVDDRFYGIDGDGHLARFRKMMQELTLDEVNAAIKKHLQYQNLKIALITGDAAGLKKALVEDTPSSVKYTSPKPKDVLAEDEKINAYKLGIPEANVTVVPVDEVFAK